MSRSIVMRSRPRACSPAQPPPRCRPSARPSAPTRPGSPPRSPPTASSHPFPLARSPVNSGWPPPPRHGPSAVGDPMPAAPGLASGGCAHPLIVASSDLRAGRHRTYRSHDPLGILMVYALWGTLLAVSATGVAMEADPFPDSDAACILGAILAEWRGSGGGRGGARRRPRGGGEPPARPRRPARRRCRGRVAAREPWPPARDAAAARRG